VTGRRQQSIFSKRKPDRAKSSNLYTVRTISPLPMLHTASHSGVPRVSILMADAGGGHRTAARSLAEAMAGEAHVSILNLLDDFTPFPFNQFSPSYGPFVNRAPWLYYLLYRSTADRRLVEAVEDACYPLIRRRLSVALLAERPDLVISVHPLLTDVPLRVLRKAGNPAPFVTVVTDPVTVHPAWFCPDVDLCVVATEDAYHSALAAGMATDRVRVIGLPIRRAFAEVRHQPKAAVKSRLGLNVERPMILLSGGGAGIGKVLPIARSVARGLAANKVDAHLAIIAGRNELLLRQLQSEPWPISVTPLGYVEQMADWMAAADLLISKAGPGTLAEAACVGTPVLVTDFIRGQESGNVRWIESSGAGAYVSQPERVAELVCEWLQPGNSTLKEMSAKASSMARPDASVEIASAALALCQWVGAM
jgi:1,2-diacylglycerol 3-beta-galactosyltransferase